MTIRASILALLVALAPAGAASRAAAQLRPQAQGAIPPGSPDAEAPTPESPTAAAVAELLMGIEDVPSLEAWRAMGPGVVPALARIASDRQQPGFVRLRAVQAAGAFATAPARTLLRRALRSGDPMMAREAAIALARAFGRASIADVAPLLAHPDSAVREGAIRALASIDDDLARGRLRARLAREADPVLREQIEAVLSAREAQRERSESAPSGEAPSGGVGARDG